jgi:hypothetical protein
MSFLIVLLRRGRVGPSFLCVLVAVLAGACAGCSNRISTYPVHGKVVYKDGTTVRGGGGLMIWFESTAPPYHRASGLVDANGEFVLSFIEAGSGAPEGEHRIRFDPGTEHMQPSAEIALGKKMPPRYLEFRTSGLKQTITRGDNIVVVEVDHPATGR